MCGAQVVSARGAGRAPDSYTEEQHQEAEKLVCWEAEPAEWGLFVEYSPSVSPRPQEAPSARPQRRSWALPP